jgi:hypothetical protein
MKNITSWFKNDQKQIQWAKTYLEKPRIKAKLTSILKFTGSHDCSADSGVDNLLIYLKSCDGGDDFITTMANAWSQDKSNKKGIKVKVESKMTKLSRKNLTSIAQNLGYHLNEVFEYLINKHIEEKKERDCDSKKKVDALKKRHKAEIDKLKLSYLSGDTVPKARYDELNSQLLSTQKSIQEIEQVIVKLNNKPSTINLVKKDQ